MAEKLKTVRLTNAAGVTVVTTEAIASRLSGFAPEKKAAKAAEKSEK